ncbi:MAG: hypothetical protein E3J60_04490 [Dehalococcoidia bacterium]|nr:MAG: hypothetical protein E3J60_04490 [Dehalococcoidia bacterium]
MKFPIRISLVTKDKPKVPTKELITQKAMVGKEWKTAYFGKEPTLQHIYEMRTDPFIKIGLSIVRHPLQRVDWSITALNPHEELPGKIKQLVENNLRAIWNKFMANMLTGIDFGYSAFEKVYKWKNGNLIYDRLVPLRPDDIELYTSALTGELTRIKQYPTLPPDAKEEQRQDAKDGLDIKGAEKLFIYTHKKEFGDIRGESRLVGVYPFWLMSHDMYKSTNTFYHRFSNPLIEAWCPSGETEIGKVDGEAKMMDNMEYLLRALENLHDHTELVHEAGEDWGMKLHEPKEGGAKFLDYLEHLNLMKLVTLFVPELAVMIGRRGSLALGKEQVELFLDNEEAILKEMGSQVDEYLINPLIDLNYGPKAPRAHWSFEPISKKMREYIAKIFQIITEEYAKQGIVHIDYGEMAERVGIPLKTTPGGEEGTEPVEGSEIALAEKTLKQWGSQIDRMEKKLSDEISEIYDLQAEAVLTRIKDLLEKRPGNISSQIRKIRIPSVGKFANMVYAQMLQAFLMGKKSATEELKVEFDKTVPDRMRNRLRARADEMAMRHGDDLLHLVVLTTLDNLDENVTNKDILSMLMEEIDKFKSKKLAIMGRHELFNAFSLGRMVVRDEHTVRK